MNHHLTIGEREQLPAAIASARTRDRNTDRSALLRSLTPEVLNSDPLSKSERQGRTDTDIVKAFLAIQR